MFLLLLSRPQGNAFAGLYDAIVPMTALELNARTSTLNSLCRMGFARITRVSWASDKVFYRITAAGRRAFPSVDTPVEEGAAE